MNALVTRLHYSWARFHIWKVLLNIPPPRGLECLVYSPNLFNNLAARASVHIPFRHTSRRRHVGGPSSWTASRFQRDFETARGDSFEVRFSPISHARVASSKIDPTLGRLAIRRTVFHLKPLGSAQDLA